MSYGAYSQGFKGGRGYLLIGRSKSLVYSPSSEAGTSAAYSVGQLP